MKRITTILSLIAMILVSGMTYADDINLFLNNHADSALRTSANQALTKPQMLFLIDIVENAAAQCDPPVCTDMQDNVITCPGSNNNNGGSGVCVSATKSESGEWQFTENLPANSGALIRFTGELCTFDADQDVVPTPAYKKITTCESGGSVDVRPVIAEIMRQRPDAKFGAMTLKVENDNPGTTDTVEPTVRSAELVLEVKSRTSAQIESAITMLGSNATKIDKSSIPTAGGLDRVYDYLDGRIESKTSPMNAQCENLHLVIMTNGGWKDDVAPNSTSLDDILGIVAPATTNAAFLQQVVTKFRDTAATGCAAKVLTSVIGLGVATNDDVNAPLFNISASSSPAMAMAEAGGGKYLNTDNGKTIVNEVLGLLDYSHPNPSALISPSSPVSASRSHNLSLLFASAFKPEGKVAWPGNMSMGTVAEWIANGNPMDPTEFATVSDLPTLTSGITIKTDLCTSPDAATGLCSLSHTNSPILTEADVTWLVGSGLDNNDVFGDPIHFKTLAIHYGDINGDGDKADHDDNPETDDVYTATPDTGELYVLVGTNRGLLHMFKYITGGTLTHEWAFFPKELERMIPALRNGNLAPSYNMVNHFYGIDGAPSVFLYDQDKDGKIIKTTPVDTDRALLYFGLRRGGATYYALDITAPGTPKLLWSKGKAIADYGTKPAAELAKTGGNRSPIPEIIPESAGGGECPVFSSHTADGLISTLPFATNTGTSCINCIATDNNPGLTTAQKEGYVLPKRENLGDFGGAVYTYVALYLKESYEGYPIFTQKNQCLYNLSQVNSFVFNAHPLAVDPMGSNGSTCYGRSTNVTYSDFRGSSGVGVASSTVHVKTIAGFDLSSLPSDAFITSAKLTFGHVGKGTVADSEVQYTSGISISAAKSGFYGNEPGHDNNGSTVCTDWDQAESTDHNYFRVGAVIQPADKTVDLGARTQDGRIFPLELFSDFYDENTGTINDLGIHALTKLLKKPINDDLHNISWQQFVVESVHDKAEIVRWGAPKAGKAASDFEYLTGVDSSDQNFSYWDAVVPKLEVTWTTTAPQTLASLGYTESSLEAKMSATTVKDFDDYLKVNPYKIMLNIETSGYGVVTGKKQGVTIDEISCGTNAGDCSKEYASSDIITLTASTKYGSTFESWSGCDTRDGVTCTVNMSESKSVTAAFTGGTSPKTLTIISSGNGAGAFFTGTSAGSLTACGESCTASYPAGETVYIKAQPASDSAFNKWSVGITGCATDSTSNSCSITMPNENSSLTAQFVQCFTAGNYDHVNAGRADPYEKYVGAGSTYAEAVGSGQDLGLIGSEWQSTVTSLKETSTDYWEKVGSCE